MDPAEKNDIASLRVPLESCELQLPSSLDGLAEIEQITEAMAQRAGFDEDTASNIAMVTREAAINAAKHGNRFGPQKIVYAKLQRNAQTMTIVIADEGEGLDPASIPDPLDPANLLRASGRGVFLMRAIMDEVHFRQLKPGTEVTLIKHMD